MLQLLIIIYLGFSFSSSMSMNHTHYQDPFTIAVKELQIVFSNQPRMLTMIKKIKHSGSKSIITSEEALLLVNSESHTSHICNENNPKKRELMLKRFILLRILYPNDKTIHISDRPAKKRRFCILF